MKLYVVLKLRIHLVLHSTRCTGEVCLRLRIVCVISKISALMGLFYLLRVGTGGGHLLSAVMNLRVPQNAGNFLTS